MTNEEDLVCGRSFQFLPEAFRPFGIFGLSFRISPGIKEFGVLTGIVQPVMIVIIALFSVGKVYSFVLCVGFVGGDEKAFLTVKKD